MGVPLAPLRSLSGASRRAAKKRLDFAGAKLTIANAPARRSKYGNRKTVIGGEIFDSAAEARRWCELQLLQRAGQIRDLTRQPKFPIIINGRKVCEYRADFAYFEGEKRVILDVKGFATPLFKLKRKLVEALYDVTIVVERA